MASITGFCGYRYNPERVNDMADVLCPPYDVISKDFQNALYQKSDVNAVRLELPNDENPYQAASESFSTWQANGILIRDSQPSIYPYHQTFKTAEGKSYTRKGFIVACKLQEFSDGVVVPHEKTLSGPKKDRLSLFRETQANFSCIFGIFSDPEKKADQLISHAIDSTRPLFSAMDYQQSENKLWQLDDPMLVEAISQSLADKRIYIADGHHRYETGLTYARERQAQNPNHTGKEPYNYIMMMLANMHDEGLIIFPTHRLVFGLNDFNHADFLTRLQQHFHIQQLNHQSELKPFLSKHNHFAYGLVTPEGILGIHLKNSIDHVLPETIAPEIKSLDVTLLHQTILTELLGISVEDQANQTHLKYSKDQTEVVEEVRNGKFQLGFVMNPTKIEEVTSVSESGHVMPQKSTFFYPKVMTGMAFNSLK